MSLSNINRAFLASLFLTTNVNASEPYHSQAEEIKYTRCEQPRPEVCNQSYQPVCGDQDTGARCIMAPCRVSIRKVTYSNSCMACADKKVYTYKEGVCSESDIEGNKL